MSYISRKPMLLYITTQLTYNLYFLPCFVCASSDHSDNEQAQRLSTSRENEEEYGSCDSTELDNKINRTIETLMRLDISLTRDSKDPPANEGEKMKEMVRQYNKACNDLLSLCKKDKLRTLSAASDMLEPGGPKFLDVGINKAEVKKNLQWDDASVDEFLNLTKETFSCWKTLWTIYNNFP